jgi:hypothetical protein
MSDLTAQERATIYAAFRQTENDGLRDVYLLGMKTALDTPARARELLTGDVGPVDGLFENPPNTTTTVRFLTYTTPAAYRAPTRSLEQRLERIRGRGR